MEPLPPFVVTTPGKVILFGEHSAVYGKKVIAGVLQSLRTYLYVDTIHTSDKQEDKKAKQFAELDFPDIKLYYMFDKWDLITYCSDLLHDDETYQNTNLNLELVDRILKYIDSNTDSKLDARISIDIHKNVIHKNAIVCFIYLYLLVNKDIQTNEKDGNSTTTRFILKSGVPIGAGLGSSASICVSLSHALLQLSHDTTQIDNELINNLAFIGEKCIHGTPSGIDNTVVTYGGIISYVKNDTLSYDNIDISKDIVDDLNLLIVNTNITRSTKQILQQVKLLHDSLPMVMDSIWNTMHKISIQCENCLQSGNLNKLPNLIKINQDLLHSINVSHPIIDNIVQLTELLQIGATKLTGAGKGGCTITLLEQSDNTKIEDLKNALNDLNCNIYQSKLGGKGTIILQSDIITDDIKKLFEDGTVSAATLTETILPLL